MPMSMPLARKNRPAAVAEPSKTAETKASKLKRESGRLLRRLSTRPVRGLQDQKISEATSPQPPSPAQAAPFETDPEYIKILQQLRLDMTEARHDGGASKNKQSIMNALHKKKFKAEARGLGLCSTSGSCADPLPTVLSKSTASGESLFSGCDSQRNSLEHGNRLQRQSPPEITLSERFSAFLHGTNTARQYRDFVPRFQLQNFARLPSNRSLISPPGYCITSSARPHNLKTPITALSKVSAPIPYRPLNALKRIRQTTNSSETVVHRSRPTQRSLSPDIELQLSEINTLTRVSIAERVAATKTFFEINYWARNGFYFGNARSRRVYLLEKQLASIQYDSEAYHVLLQNFRLNESNCLRELRMQNSGYRDDREAVRSAGYEVVRLLGKGSFGVVTLVRDKSQKTVDRSSNENVYAMKVIRKGVMIRNAQEGHLRAERDFLASCAETSRWVVPLISSFQDFHNLYLVMEFEIGGDFLNLMLRSKNGIISEGWTRWYIAEMILCVEETHSMNWIHRDIKPDNFLISASGHLKISDFGLSFNGHWAHCQRYYHSQRYALLESLNIQIEGDSEDKEKSKKRRSKPGATSWDQGGTIPLKHKRMAHSIVGTSQYMAPEIVTGSYYDGRCDWWSIGIILYECLYGRTPFIKGDRESTKRAIAMHEKHLAFFPAPQRISSCAIDLIKCLLRDASHRLSCPQYRLNNVITDAGKSAPAGDKQKSHSSYARSFVYRDDAIEIKRHPFFTGIPWDKMHMLVPPWVPEVQKKNSTRYFESEERIIAGFSTDMYDSELGIPEMALDALLKQQANFDGSYLALEQEKVLRENLRTRRPKDKLLRDSRYMAEVLKQRKRHAFIGYTYRRPHVWSSGDEMRLGVTHGGWSSRHTETKHLPPDFYSDPGIGYNVDNDILWRNVLLRGRI